MRIVLVIAFIAAGLGGCLTGDDAPLSIRDAPKPADFSHLDATGAEVVDAGDTRTFVFQGTVGSRTSAALIGTLPGSAVASRPFEVDGTVGFVSAKTREDGFGLYIRDHEERISCGAFGIQGCTAPVDPSINGTTQFRVDVYRLTDVDAVAVAAAVGEAGYVLEATLHQIYDLTRPDIDDQLSKRLSFIPYDTGFDGGEPTLGVNKEGAIFDVVGSSTIRSRDGGATWEDVTPPLTTTTLDPMLYLDPWSGRLFTDHLYVACSYLSWSDDEGETWITNPAACGNTAIDHQKLAVGGTPLPAGVFSGVVYFSYNSFALLAPNAAHLVVSRSLDGGVTWAPSVAATEAMDFGYRTGGPIAADREGNVYVPMYLSDGGFGVTVSNDHGVTWNAQRIGEDSAANEGIDPGLAIDADGNAYGAYWGYGGVRVTASTDKGATWSDTAVVSPPGLRSFVLADAVAGDAGRVAVAYLATADTDKGPNAADGWARWHLYLSFSEDALEANATWETVRVTPADDPVQVGTICTGGIGCSGGNRNLLDFIDLQPGPDGRIHIAYTDGCLPPDDGASTELCDTPPESRARRGYVAVQQDGPDLFADKAPWA